jgi:hypothetical protein
MKKLEKMINITIPIALGLLLIGLIFDNTYTAELGAIL